MAAFDSDFDLCSERREQNEALAEFESLGGNLLNLEAVLEQTAARARQLRREQHTVFEYVAAVAAEKEHRTKLERIAKAKAACETIPMEVPPGLIEEETKTAA